jgi:excisionase family DNA binding protein
MSDDEKMIKVKDVAEKIKVNRSTVYKLLSAGKIPSPVKIGRSVRWRLAEINAWISAGCPTVGAH